MKVGVQYAVEDSAVDFPTTGIKPGDDVRVSFHELNGQRVAQGVEELATRQ
jgi:hypothetical protein